MGRQSARLLNNKKDHKDIFFNGNYHTQMWVTDAQANPTLVWEKLPEDNYFGLILNDTLIVSDFSSNTPEKNVVYIYAEVFDYSEKWLTIDWGDGTIEKEVTGKLKHNYPTSNGTKYEVKIYGEIGEFQAWTLSNNSYCSAVVGITTPIQATMTTNTSLSYPSFTQMFAHCKGLKTLPKDLLINFKDYNGSNYINTNSMFKYSGLETLPIDLFSGMKILGNDIFANCNYLQSINPSIFTGADVYSFEAMFNNCISLNSVPYGLFSSKNNISFRRCFENCTSLVSVPENLFDDCPNILRVDSCFKNCSSITSKVPALWERTFSNADFYSDCYYMCYNASNYSEIPVNWK